MASNPYWAKLNQPSAEELGSVFMEALTRPENIQIFCAEVNGEVAGYANTWTVYSIWSGGMALTVDDLYIALPFRGRGIGEAMMKYLMNYAEKHNFKRVQLHAEPDNHRAHSLYRKLKFQKEAMFYFMKLI